MMRLEWWLEMAMTIIVAFFVVLAGLALVISGLTGGRQVSAMTIRILMVALGCILMASGVLLPRIWRRLRRGKE